MDNKIENDTFEFVHDVDGFLVFDASDDAFGPLRLRDVFRMVHRLTCIERAFQI